MPERDGRGLRWWPAIVVLALYGGALVWIRGIADSSYQDRFMDSAFVSAVAALLLFGWWVMLSRAGWRLRLGVAALVVAATATLAASLEVTGVSGDVVPILRWRWAASDEVEARRAGGALEVDAVAAFPQFLGPGRNGVVAGLDLARDWEARPPREVWRRPVGEGWSGFAVARGLAVTQEQHGALEKVRAYELTSGELRWEHEDAARYETAIAGIGPRATPTIDDGMVFTLGATGLLNALELESGRSVWRRDIHADSGAPNKEWGRSCSPLVVDGLVVVSAGGGGGKSLLAYERASGEIAWTAGSDPSSYSSPLVATLAGRRQIVMLNKTSVTGHDLTTGAVLWRVPWDTASPSVAQPVVVGRDRLLVSAGYGMGSKLVAIETDAEGELTARELWRSPRLKAKFANFVLHDGKVYGLDDGVLVCLDLANGERCWKRGRYGHGQLLLVGGLLVVTAENGEVVLVEASPAEHRELGRFTAFERKTWNPPALVGPYLLIRNDQEAALYELPRA
jgi:outer membrane protein assembly factor BamB